MEIKNLKTFLTVVETGSFTRAAELLGYTQSTVSFQIQQLENELNCRLFDRYSHSISLTDRGRMLQRHALELDRSFHSLIEDFSATEAPEGKIRIYSSDSICEKMMNLNYQEFFSRYPEIKLSFTTTYTDVMFQALEENKADVLFTLDTHIFKPNFVIVKESPVKLSFVTSAHSPLAGRGTLTIHDILPYPFLLTEPGMSYRKVLDSRLAEESLVIDPVLEAGRTDILLNCIENGNSISFLPDFVTEDKVREGKIIRLDVENYDLTIWKQLIYHKDKWRSKAFNAFIEFVTEHEFLW